MSLFRRKKSDDHQEVQQVLRLHTRKLADMNQRLREIEVRARIYRPPVCIEPEEDE